nr:transposase [Acidocella sp. KAb 2-4]
MRDGRRRYDPASKARLVASCVEPGVSISRLALDHGINTNLLRKWIKDAQEAGPQRPSSRPAFIPIVAADSNLPIEESGALAMPAPRGDGRLATSVRVSASLPNGVTLTLDCGNVDALAAIIGALGHVQTGG